MTTLQLNSSKIKVFLTKKIFSITSEGKIILRIIFGPMKKVIPFQRNDFDAVKKLLIEGFSSKYKNDINENFFLLNNYGFVLKEDEKLLGFASIHVINKINRISCLIEDVVIDSNYRGKGLGKLLINHLIKFSKTLGSDKIILNSQESNTKFYEKLGFKKNETQMIIRL